MLLEFKIKNYKSFYEETKFSMTPAPKQSGLDYSILKSTIKRKNIKGLCSSVIYGPNASGKTNIIGAMDVLRAIVLRGNIRNSKEEKNFYNPASSILEFIPNSQINESKPVEFAIDFIENNLRIQYNLCIDLGLFLEQDYKRKITSEELIINNATIFKRDNNIYIGDIKQIKEYLADTVIKNLDNAKNLANANIDTEELFLTNSFKNIFSPSLVKIIIDWFSNKFMVICRADSVQLVRRFADPQKNAVYVEKVTDKPAKIFGANSNAIGYILKDDNSEPKLFSLLSNDNNDVGKAIPADFFESYGTIRFINMFPLVVRAIQTGSTLIVDEFDASIHPMALMSIINLFHNDDINIHKAQLIFNTHNPIFLNSNLFRRDEIKFVERDDENHFSILYSLADFGTSGEKGVRKHEDYMKNYFISQYGAIKDIDFTPFFEEIRSDKSEL